MIPMTHDTLPHGVASPGFLRQIGTIPFDRIARSGRETSAGDVTGALAHGHIDLEAAAALLGSGRVPDPAELLRAARDMTDRVFGRSILLYAPCYLSSHCVNLCSYCGFNYSMPIPRRRLTLGEAASEIGILTRRGMRRVLLVAGEYPSRVDPGYIEDAVRAAAALAPEIRSRSRSFDGEDLPPLGSSRGRRSRLLPGDVRPPALRRAASARTEALLCLQAGHARAGG